MKISTGGKFVIPEVVVSQFHLREGDKVADFGSGSGFFTKVLSTHVGEEGVVHACEIQKRLVERLGELARAEGLTNVHPLWCDLEEANGIKIADGVLDVALLVNTLFLIEDKETAVREMSRTLRSGGKFFVIDWTESFGGLGPMPDHVVAKATVIQLFEENGYVLEREFEAGAHHYGLAFRKV